MKFLLGLADGRNEPIKDLDNAKRIVLVDKDTVGAEDITFAYCRFEAKTSAHKKHVHEHAEEIIYIIQGRGISGLGDSEVEMKKGDTMFGAVGIFSPVGILSPGVGQGLNMLRICSGEKSNLDKDALGERDGRPARGDQERLRRET